MSKFSTAAVNQLAQLIQLELSESESKQFAKEMDQTIGFIENLSQLPTEAAKPTYQTTGISNRFLEEDLNERHLSPEQALSNAPHHKQGYFQIKGLGYVK
jgi:aspartyl/glutamyl-tRNA(Asn/Gln) amidotransferase C subunit